MSKYAWNMKYKNIKVLSKELIRLPNGTVKSVDNKRYGGNGFLRYDIAEGKCEFCGSEENLCIHHENGYSNDINDLVILCRKCHRNYELVQIPDEFK